MNDVEKKVLKLIAKIADGNAATMEKKIPYCPVFLHQPKRPEKQTNKSSKKL